AYRMLFAEEGTLQERLADVAEKFAGSRLVGDVVEFIRADSSRSICQPRDERA
ncbi:MAG: acyl-[acyl-carrier-protein]--UDP-N-acetylglucosamine O-acyltransferase, partial [Alphaproteobacteria bacterium]|nr:acyl-[acyl-carrier-protein]--UDP-N-acetylglucosamine O-acyltransferase [Alphaproteobacteria bacterium]